MEGLLSSPSVVGQSMIQEGFLHDGVWRDYWVHLPQSYVGSHSFPLIVNLHGFGSDAESQAIYTAMNQVADTAGIIIVYPQGILGELPWLGKNTHWNAFFNEEVDDLGFLDRLLDRLLGTYAIDPARIYVTGHSNGGFMSYLLACERSDRIAAVASVAGSMHNTQFRHCQPLYPVPILLIHGTEDRTIKFDGSSHYASVDQLVDFWVETYSCSPQAETIHLPNLDTQDQSTVSVRYFSSCENGSTEVHVYHIQNGGHTWPGTTEYFEQIGVVNQDIHASEVIWEFFRRYTHPSPSPPKAFTEESSLGSPQLPFSWSYDRSSDQLQVHWPEEIPHWVQMQDMAGQEVYHSPYPGVELTIDVHGLASGIYLIRSKQGGKIRYQKIGIIK